MDRRGFLKSILAAGVAPYVMSGGIASGILMPVRQLLIASAAVIEFLNRDGLILATGTYADAKLNVPLSTPVLNTGALFETRLRHPMFGTIPIHINLTSDILVVGSTLNVLPLQLISTPPS